MSESARKRKNNYVYHPKDRCKLTCFFLGPVHLSYECKVSKDFVSKYSKSRPTKDRGQEPVDENKFNRNQENNAIVQNSVDDILLQENMKLSVE